jgi:O-palmitoleoyl-L-serine hydrolase
MLFCLPVLAFPLKLNFLKGGDARCLDGSEYSFYT